MPFTECPLPQQTKRSSQNSSALQTLCHCPKPLAIREKDDMTATTEKPASTLSDKTQACGHARHEHGHDHAHEHGHDHGHDHEHGHCHAHSLQTAGSGQRILTIRCHSGLAGDILLTGFSRLLSLDDSQLNKLAKDIMPELAGCLAIEAVQVNSIGGFRAKVDLPHQHEHRTLADIRLVLEKSAISDYARDLALSTFALLAEAEGRVHGRKPDEVHFHEVGALDSILDITLACVLFEKLDVSLFQASPLPVADGSVLCQHGVLPVPAPAVLELLDGIPVVPFAGQGETVTPTAIALLKSLHAQFGPWPAMRIEKHVLAYGTKVFANAPNGAVFALGSGI